MSSVRWEQLLKALRSAEDFTAEWFLQALAECGPGIVMLGWAREGVFERLKRNPYKDPWVNELCVYALTGREAFRLSVKRNLANSKMRQTVAISLATVSGRREDREDAIIQATHDTPIVDSVNYLMRLAEEMADRDIADHAKSLWVSEPLRHELPRATRVEWRFRRWDHISSRESQDASRFAWLIHEGQDAEVEDWELARTIWLWVTKRPAPGSAFPNFAPVDGEDLKLLRPSVRALALAMLARAYGMSEQIQAADRAIKDCVDHDHFAQAALMQFAPVENNLTAFMSGWGAARILCTNEDELYPIVGPQFFSDLRKAVQARLSIG